MDPYIIAYLLGRPTMSFALHLTGRENNLRHIKAKSFIIISINSIHAVTYVLHCILLATGQKKILLNQQHWKTSLPLYKLMIPHFPEPILCHIIWRLGIFNQMKTAGLLQHCFITQQHYHTHPNGRIWWLWNRQATDLAVWRHVWNTKPVSQRKSYKNGSNLAAPSQNFIHLSQAGLVEWVSPHASCRNAPLTRAPQEGLCLGMHIFWRESHRAFPGSISYLRKVNATLLLARSLGNREMKHLYKHRTSALHVQ